MFDFLERLYKKPERKRRMYAVSVSLGITAVIFAVWLSVILPTSINTEVENSNNSWTKNIVSPLGTFKKNTMQAFDSLKGQLSSMQAALKTNTSVYTAETSTSSAAKK